MTNCALFTNIEERLTLKEILYKLNEAVRTKMRPEVRRETQGRLQFVSSHLFERLLKVLSHHVRERLCFNSLLTWFHGNFTSTATTMTMQQSSSCLWTASHVRRGRYNNSSVIQGGCWSILADAAAEWPACSLNSCRHLGITLFFSPCRFARVILPHEPFWCRSKLFGTCVEPTTAFWCSNLDLILDRL